MSYSARLVERGGTWMRRLGWCRRYAWVVPCLYGILLVLASLWWLVTGTPFDAPTYGRIVGVPWAQFSRALPPPTARLTGALFRELGGNLGLVAGLLTIAIAVNGFRRGERWAWYALWVLPLHAGLDLARVVAYGATSVSSVTWDVSLMVATVLSLVVARR